MPAHRYHPDHRTQTDQDSLPIQRETFEILYQELESRYPGKVRRILEIAPVAVTVTIDNEDDARQTLNNIKRKYEIGRVQRADQLPTQPKEET